MEFRMYESGIYFYNPTDDAAVLINTVSGIKQGFSNRKINGADPGKKLY